ncbi:integrase [Paenibacillus sp. V4I9]|uniref:hypothetical protein n=1 Tax=Paenibacillus sp. V4I9 TaxID=3042308 RepID=UPI002783A523|nr:hypothetical protein [Paenibacillus sp. V4I9]MDQ0888950.1 integrase [Paenibacillus sp. V4I9]
MRESFALSLNVDELTINENKNTQINLNVQIPLAKSKLQEYFDYQVKVISASFDDDLWVFKQIYNKRYLKIEFDKIFNITQFSKIKNKKQFVDVVKCWIVLKLDENGLDNVKAIYFDIVSAIYATQCFSKDTFKVFFNNLKNNMIYRFDRSEKEYSLTKVNDTTLSIYCRHIIDFLSFYDNNQFFDFINKTNKIKSQLKIEDKSRELPSYSDIIKFKKYIDTWAEQLFQRENLIECIRFFPVYLWWELTTIIPMRPTEFCTIRKNCLDKDDNLFYITFPRLKKRRKGENRVNESFDTLPIPELVYNRIEQYIKLAEKNELSDFLFNFDSFVESTREVSINYEDEEVFSIHYLFELISKFYKQIIHEQYKVNINDITGHYKNIMFTYRKDSISESLIHVESFDFIERVLKPGDLRHIAILNMFLQGYDPVEIQRLAGHIHESTQLGYQRHMEVWVDSQIQQLALEFSSNNYQLTNYDDYRVTIHPKAVNLYNKMFKRSAFLNSEVSLIPEEQNLEIGFCSEETMPCPTFNWKVSGCYFCKYWRISTEDLEKKRDLILKDISLFYDELRGKVNFMKSLLMINLNEFGDVDLENRRRLTVASNEVQDGILSIAKIISMIGVNRSS